MPGTAGPAGPSGPAPTTSPRPGRRRVLVPTLVVLGVLALLFAIFTGFYTDLLWYRSLGYSDVFTTRLRTQVGLFVVFGVVAAYRLRPPFRPRHPEQDSLERYRIALEPYKVLAVVVVAAGQGLLSGASAASEWKTFMLWRNSSEFGQTDPQFNRDVSFYAFELPWWRYVLGFAFAIVVLSLIASLVTHYLFGGIRLQVPGDKFTPAATAHISVLLGAFVLLKAVAYWLDRFSLAVRSGQVGDQEITGLKFRDVQAVLPAKNILMAIAFFCAILFFANAFRRTWALPGVAFGLLVLSAVLVGGVYPALVQQFQVRPNEASKEAPYIQRNIDATRTAFGLDGVEVQDYNATSTTTPEKIRADRGTIENVRLLDPAVVTPTYRNLQQIRGFYGFADPLDVDRYEIDGVQRDAVVAVREVVPNEGREANWINDHQLYTHGYGMVAAYGNELTTDGQPSFFASDIPPTGKLTIDQPRVYFGETSPDYSIVGAPEGAPPAELDYPDDASPNGQRNNTYDGSGGVPIGNTFNKLLYAVKFQETRILLSSDINEESQILYDRGPRLRVQRAAPWLTVDGDPYPAVVNGRITWILDGYTTSNGYPYSSNTTLDDATADSTTAQSQFVAAQRQTQVNYIRNSVKATVDAYDGTVTLYGWDENDPVLKTWSKAFPGTVTPRSEMSPELIDHIRYPQDLFKVQRELFARYHVTDPAAFYGQQDFWEIPDDPTQGRTGNNQPPYYLTIKMPGTESASFSLTSTFAPRDRANLAAFMAADSEPGENYGKIRVLQLPRNTVIPGPGQVQNNFESNSSVAQELTLLRQGGAEIRFGNLLSLPVGGGMLYVEPVYVQAAAGGGATFPLLRKVLVSFGNQVGFEDTLGEAVDAVFQGNTGISTPTVEGEGTPPEGEQPAGDGGGGTPADASAALAQAIADAEQAYADGEAALANQDFAAYGEAQQRLEAALNRASAAADAVDGG
jgi:uncharacterized membrane protein (UPF0182 family)